MKIDSIIQHKKFIKLTENLELKYIVPLLLPTIFLTPRNIELLIANVKMSYDLFEMYSVGISRADISVCQKFSARTTYL